MVDNYTYKFHVVAVPESEGKRYAISLVIVGGKFRGQEAYHTQHILVGPREALKDQIQGVVSKFDLDWLAPLR